MKPTDFLFWFEPDTLHLDHDFIGYLFLFAGVFHCFYFPPYFSYMIYLYHILLFPSTSRSLYVLCEIPFLSPDPSVFFFRPQPGAP